MCISNLGKRLAARRLWYRDKAYSSSRSWRWQQTGSECWVSCSLGLNRSRRPPSKRVSAAVVLANKICVRAPAVGWGWISQRPSARATICCWLTKGKGWDSRSRASAGRKERLRDVEDMEDGWALEDVCLPAGTMPGVKLAPYIRLPAQTSAW